MREHEVLKQKLEEKHCEGRVEKWTLEFDTKVILKDNSQER